MILFLVEVLYREILNINKRPLANKEINIGIYVFKSWTLFNLLPMVGNNNSQNEYFLFDVLNLILEKNGKVVIKNKIFYWNSRGE